MGGRGKVGERREGAAPDPPHHCFPYSFFCIADKVTWPQVSLIRLLDHKQGSADILLLLLEFTVIPSHHKAV